MFYKNKNSRPATISKKKKVFSRKSRSRKSVSRVLAIKDTTIIKYNPGRAPILRTLKCLPLFLPYTNGVVGVNGLQFVCGATNVTASSSMIFDPSGTYGTASAQITASGPFTGAPAPVIDWPSFQRLYSHYRVTKITCRFTAQDIGSLVTAPPIIYVRYANVYPTINPTVNGIADQRNWVRKTFTPEHPDFTYSFYPKVMVLTDNIGLLATEPRVPKSMPWTNLTTPSDLYGLQVIFQYPGSTSGTSTFVNMDIEYHMQFKTAN